MVVLVNGEWVGGLGVRRVCILVVWEGFQRVLVFCWGFFFVGRGFGDGDCGDRWERRMVMGFGMVIVEIVGRRGFIVLPTFG